MSKQVNFVHVSVPMPVADSFLQNLKNRENYRFFRFTDDADMADLMVKAGPRESAVSRIKQTENGLSISEGFSMFDSDEGIVLRIVNKMD